MVYYVVVCRGDDEREEVLASRRMFEDAIAANRYASTIASGRKARVMYLTDYLISVEGWRITS